MVRRLAGKKLPRSDFVGSHQEFSWPVPLLELICSCLGHNVFLPGYHISIQFCCHNLECGARHHCNLLLKIDFGLDPKCYRQPMIEIKSDNLQYNALVWWFTWRNDLLTKCQMFQALFFYNFLWTWGTQNCLFSFFFCKFTNNKKINWNNFKKDFARNCENYELEHQTLVDESFVPASQQTSISYWKLTNFCRSTDI